MGLERGDASPTMDPIGSDTMLDSEKLREMRDIKLRETKRNEGQNCVPLYSDFSYKYNVFTSCQVDFQPTKLAKLTCIYLQLIMLIERMII